MNSETKAARATGWALVGFLLMFGGPAVYLALIDFPLMHASGAPAFGLMAAGATAGLVAAMRDRRIWVRFLFIVDALLLAVWTYAFYVWAALPAPAALSHLQVAPDFSLLDHNGQKITLSEVRAQGPVLLVFYRGHW